MSVWRMYVYVLRTARTSDKGSESKSKSRSTAIPSTSKVFSLIRFVFVSEAFV